MKSTNREGIFTLLAAKVLALGIFFGCFFIALSNRYLNTDGGAILHIDSGNKT